MTDNTLFFYTVAARPTFGAHYLVNTHRVALAVRTQQLVVVHFVENALFAVEFVAAHLTYIRANRYIIKPAPRALDVFHRHTPNHSMTTARQVLLRDKQKKHLTTLS